MKKVSFYIVIAAITFLISSCGIQSKTNYIINPDLTCKCVFEEKVGLDVAMITTYYGKTGTNSNDPTGLSSMFGGDSTMPSNHDILLGFASKILSNKGVETWRDVEFKIIGNDTAYFKGTAYFKYLANGGLSGIDSGMRVYKDDMGQTVIEMKQEKKDTISSATADIYKNLFKGGLYYSMMHYYMASLFRDFNISVTYQLPGKIVSISNFTKVNDNTALLSINGKAMIRNLDTLMRHTDMMSKLYSNPAALSSMSSNNPYAANSFIFGQDKPVRVIYKNGDKPQFDYEKEVAEAKKQYAAFRKKSGLDAYDSIADARQKMLEFEKTKEEGTLILTASDSANGKLYFKSLTAKQYYRSYQAFSGELSKPLNSGYYCTVDITSATTDNGINVTDSIQNHDYISAYMSSSSYNYEDTVQAYDKVSFTMNSKFPDDCKFVNLEGKLIIDSVHIVPFKIINLYLSTKTITDGEDEEGYK